MKSPVIIKSLNGRIIYSCSKNNILEAIEEAITLGTSLKHANLSNQRLNGINLSGIDCSGADFSGSTLYGADLRRAHLPDTNFHGADLYGADLRNADISDSDLQHAKLYRAKLNHASLLGANLRYAKLDKADLSFASGLSKLMGVAPGNYYWKRFGRSLCNNGYHFHVGLNELHPGDIFADDERMTCSYPGFHFASRSWCKVNYPNRPYEALIRIPMDAKINEPWATDGKASADKIEIIQVFDRLGADVTDSFRK